MAHRVLSPSCRREADEVHRDQSEGGWASSGRFGEGARLYAKGDQRPAARKTPLLSGECNELCQSEMPRRYAGDAWWDDAYAGTRSASRGAHRAE